MKKILIALSVIILLAVGAVFFLFSSLNNLIKKGIENAGPEKLKVTTSVEKVNVSYFSGSGTIHNLKVGNPKGYQSDYAFKMDLLHIELNVDSIKSKESEKIHIKKLLMLAPEIVFEGDFTNSNLAQIGENAKSSRKKPQKKMQVDYLKIEDAKIHLKWKKIPDKKFSITLKNIEVKDIGKSGETNTADVIKQVIERVRAEIFSKAKQEIHTYIEKTKEAGKEHIEKIKEKMKNKKPPFKKPPFKKPPFEKNN